MTVEEMIDKVRNEYIEQIYALKSEVESKSKELEVFKKELAIYKKSLKMMSEELTSTYDCDQSKNEICKICMSDIERMKTNTCADFLVQYYLRKARGEEE